MRKSDELLMEIEAFLDRSGMAATTFGQKCLLNSKLVGRLRSGGSVTLETADQIRAFIAARDVTPKRKRRSGAGGSGKGAVAA